MKAAFVTKAKQFFFSDDTAGLGPEQRRERFTDENGVVGERIIYDKFIIERTVMQAEGSK